jgi:hypothetical protein
MKRANILLSHGVRGSGIEERHSGNDSSMLDIWGLAEIPPTAGEQKEGGLSVHLCRTWKAISKG